jgi:hypothetical protein
MASAVLDVVSSPSDPFAWAPDFVPTVDLSLISGRAIAHRNARKVIGMATRKTVSIEWT